MLSNHTIEFLEERIAYNNECLEKYPDMKELINRDIEKYTAMKVEAENREVVGFDTRDNAIAYLAKSEYNDKPVLYVEGKPSGWYAESFNIKVDNETEVCYDGGSKWYSTIRFTVNK